MKKRKLLILIFALSLSINNQLSTTNCSASPFSQDHWSTRTAGMGNTFTGVADDAGTIWFNPAGTGRLELPQVMYNSLFPYISRENVTYYNAQSLALVFPYDKEFAWGLAWNEFGVKNNYKENTLILNMSAKLNAIVPLAINDLYLGLNLKGLFYTPNQTGKDLFDSLTDGTSTNDVFGADAGILYKVNRNMRLGMAVLNLNRPAVYVFDELARIPVESRLGASYDITKTPVQEFLGINKITPAFDLVRKNDKWSSNVGAEAYFFNNLFALRGGVNSDEATAGLSIEAIRAGNYDINLNYSFIYSYGLDSHDRLNMISIRLTRKPSTEKHEASSKEEKISPYTFGPDDGIEIITRNHDEFSGKFTVDPYGKIFMSLTGEILVEGLTKDELTDKLKQEIGKFVQDPNVQVTIDKYRSKVVYILGEVRTPGRYPIEGDSIELREAIANAGFPTGLAATWRVYIIQPRPYRPTYKIVNLYDILYRGKMANNVMVTPGQIIYVPMTILGKLATTMSYLLDPFFKTRSLATPLSTPKPLVDETQTTITNR